MNLSLSPEILALLVCPVSRQPLHLATADEAATWIATEAFDGVLVTADAAHAYPIREGFPILIASEALSRRP